MWYRKLLGVSAALALVLAACTTPTGESPTPGATGDGSPAPTDGGGGMAEDQTFRIPGAEPPTLDPNIATDSASILVLEQITRPLIWWDEELQITTEGGLAESFEVSDDGLTVTFTIKEGAAFSNGDPITAGDFVYSWKRLVDPRTAAGYSYVMGDVVGGAELLELAGAEELPADEEIDAMLDELGVEAVDDSTFQVTLSRPAAFFPFIAGLWMTSPIQQDWVESGQDFTEAENYVGSGPFMLSEWSHDELIVLEPNPNWVGEAPMLEAIEIHITDDPEIDYQAYLNDEVDIAAVPGAHAEEVRSDAELSEQAITGDVLCTYYLGFNVEHDFVSNQALRHAIAQAIDRETLITTVLSGVQTAADSFVPEGMPGHQPGIGPQQFDVDQAQANLETALSELGLSDASEITLTLGFNSGSGHEDIMEYVQEQVQTNLGITLNLEGQEWGTYLQTLDEDAPDLFRLGWCQDYPHPHNFLFDVFSCDSGNNHTGYCNEEYDALLEEGAVTPTLEEQLPLYEQAQEILVEDSPAVFIYWYGRFTLVKPWVQGLTPTAGDSTLGSYFYDRVFISDARDQ